VSGSSGIALVNRQRRVARPIQLDQILLHHNVTSIFLFHHFLFYGQLYYSVLQKMNDKNSYYIFHFFTLLINIVHYYSRPIIYFLLLFISDIYFFLLHEIVPNVLFIFTKYVIFSVHLYFRF